MREFIQGKQLEAEGRHLEAVDAYFKAVVSDPANGEYCAAFAHSIRFLTFNQPNPFLHHAILNCFDNVAVNPQDLAVPAFSLLALSPEYHVLCQAASEGTVSLLNALDTCSLIKDTLFLSLLQKTVVPDPHFEQLIISIRNALLDSVVHHPLNITPFLDLLLAIATQCFLNEYVYLESDEESCLIESLCHHLQFPLTASAAPAIVLLAAYRPLHSYSFASSLMAFSDSNIHALIKIQIIEPQQERALITSIPVLNPIKNPISQKVQEQYEENPYPRWNYIAERHPVESDEVLHEIFPWLEIEKISNPEILIAGCGTGRQAIQAALTYKDAHIVAIDLSAASLAYAKRQADERGVDNITFMQGDILDLDLIVKRFDIIEAVGVLHHMEDPMAGWMALRRVLKESGWMNIGLYSEIGRQDICAARRYIAQQEFLPTLKGIRLCRQQLFRLAEDDPIKDVTRTIDFYTTSSCRDLIFHVQEHRFSILQIVECLKKLDLDFVGFDLPLKSIFKEYRVEYPNDPPEGTLSHWHAFELRHPTTFIGMYQFWVKPHRT